MTYRVASRLLVLAISAAFATSAFAGDDAADQKTIDRIRQGLDLTPSLYATSEAPVKFKALPKLLRAST